jgi:hypothetical protein
MAPGWRADSYADTQLCPVSGKLQHLKMPCMLLHLASVYSQIPVLQKQQETGTLHHAALHNHHALGLLRQLLGYTCREDS